MTTRLLCIAIFASAAAHAAPQKPNIIILADDLGRYGDTPIRTPNLDKLAANGIRFNDAYASNTACSPPTRTSSNPARWVSPWRTS